MRHRLTKLREKIKDVDKKIPDTNGLVTGNNSFEYKS